MINFWRATRFERLEAPKCILLWNSYFLNFLSSDKEILISYQKLLKIQIKEIIEKLTNYFLIKISKNQWKNFFINFFSDFQTDKNIFITKLKIKIDWKIFFKIPEFFPIFQRIFFLKKNLQKPRKIGHFVDFSFLKNDKWFSEKKSQRRGKNTKIVLLNDLGSRSRK